MRRAFLVRLLLAARRRGVVVESFAQQLAGMPTVGKDEDFERCQQDPRATPQLTDNEALDAR
jgi:hypothetical protein